MKGLSKPEMQTRIDELELRLEESEQLIDAIKAGEVDAFAINKNSESEIFTLQSGDYAYRILIEKFGEGALNVTEDGLIVYTNSYFCNLINMPYEKVIGSYITDFVHPEYVKRFAELFQQSLSKNSKGELKLKASAQEIPVYLSFTSLQPKLATVGIIVTDYTEKKNIENVILNYQTNLELKINELKQSNSELAAFVYVASHDLQEPLRKIQTFASRIEDTDLKSLSKNGLNYFNKMQLEAERMHTLIKDLLAYSRTNKPELKYVKSDLKKVVEEVINELQEDLDERKAVIEVQAMCNAYIIRFQFKQLLNNLISNAIKFARPNKAPHIIIKSEIVQGKDLFEKKKCCHIHVSDKGIGFKQQHSEKIFEVFQRLHGKSEYKGTGIGLAIVKKIVDNHNGVITATSTPNHGATFDIYIPLRQ